MPNEATKPLSARKQPQLATSKKRKDQTRKVKSLSKNHFINRELSWLQFNARVLEEALSTKNPLLERVRFLSIFASNLDEFFMIRVSGLRRQLAAGALELPPDGMTASEQLAQIRERLAPLLEKESRCWEEDLRPQLEAAGIRVLSYEKTTAKQQKALRKRFKSEILPALTPLAFDPGHPFPHISNLSINLAVLVNDPEYGNRFARLKVPHLMFPRLLPVPEQKRGDRERRSLGLTGDGPINLVWLEEVVAANLDLLFPALEIKASYPFRVTRNADIEIEDDEASDLLTVMEGVVGQRHFGFAVRLQIDNRMGKEFRDILISKLGIAPYQVYASDGPLGHADLAELTDLNRPDLKYPPFLPVMSPALTVEDNPFSVIKHRDVFFCHPYDSFGPVVDFIRKAAQDPQVLAIKQTLYRVGPNSPIVESLRIAREEGKQVSALVELKARFDEANNITWAKTLERAGVHVVYGLLGLKTHAKMCLVVRREQDGTRSYVHLGTGNYNPVTARAYVDAGFMTSDPDIAADVSDLFNALTGYSNKESYRKLLVSPGAMREEILKRIRREIRAHKTNGEGFVAFKMNALVDRAIIEALCKASQAGVRVELQVRGICCLRPGVPGVSENIRVTSILGRFLEHSRIYYFRNSGEEEIFLGSADLMPRNLDGRVEILFPIEDPQLRDAITDEILFLHLEDNVGAWELESDGTYRRLEATAGSPRNDAQNTRLAHKGGWHFE